jgi:hypothetical protein
MRIFRRYFQFAVAALLAVLFSQEAAAHPAQFTNLQVKVDPAGGFKATVNIDILAFALGIPSANANNEELTALLDGPRAALEKRLADSGNRFRNEVVVRTDAGDAAISSWKFPGLPEVETSLARRLEPRILMPGTISFSGEMPYGAHSLAIRLPYVLGDTVHVFELPEGVCYAEPVAAGAYTSKIDLKLKPPTAKARLAAFGRYITIGFEHILPKGLDHILFVVGLFLLSTRLSSLLWQVSAFTIAHSITLGLSLYGVVQLPSSIVEPLIAASIAFIAIENLFTSKLHAWRPFVVFGFGLVHGLGFAGALAKLGLPRSDYLLGLVGFNVGVECGQLAVIALAFLAVGWFQNRPWYRRAIVIPASACIALVALFWTVQRIYWPA